MIADPVRSNNLWAAGDFGGVKVSRDGGQTWNSTAQFFDARYVSSCDGKIAIWGKKDGGTNPYLLWYSADDGATWTAQTTVAKNFHGIQGLTVDRNGKIWVSWNSCTVVTPVVGATTADTQAPTVPTGLSSSNVTSSSLTLSWTASTDNVGVSQYEVFRGGTSQGTVSGTTYNAIGLTASTAYSYTIRALDAASNASAQSTALSVTTSAPAGDTQAPTVPTSLSSSTVTQTGFTLNWAASTDNVGVTAYEVFRGGVSQGTVTGTSFSATGLTASTAYSMTVRARDAANNNSAQSTALSVTTSAAAGGVTGTGNVTLETWSNVSGTTVAAIPTGTTPNTTSTLTSLETVSNAADNYGVRIRGYIIPTPTGSYTFYIASDDNGRFSLSTNDQPSSLVSGIATVGDWTSSREWNKFPSQTSAAKSLTAGTRYYFEALMKEGGGGDNLAIGWTGPGISAITVIGSANLDRFVTGTADTQAPSVPSGLTSSNVTSSSLTLSWTASTDNVGVSLYEVFRGGVSQGTVTGTSYNATGLTASTAYSFTVRARDAANNNSAQSTALGVTTSAPAGDTQAPSVPSSLSSASVAQTSFTLNWAASTDNVGVALYEVFRGGVSQGTVAGTSFNATGLTASTAYSMTVRARDAAGNNSAQSTALGVTTAAATSTAGKYEAESGTLAGGAVVSTTYSGFTGTGYVNGLQNNGASVAFSVNVSTAGTYNVTLRYGNAAGPSYQAALYVNGTRVSTETLSSNNSWTTWQTVIVSATLNAGANTIRFQKDADINGGAYNIDFITIPSTPGALAAAQSDELLRSTSTTVEVYPNPASGSFSVSSANDAKITITSLDGRVIKTISANGRVTTIDSGNWSAGMYIIQVQSATGTTVKKVVISK